MPEVEGEHLGGRELDTTIWPQYAVAGLAGSGGQMVDAQKSWAGYARSLLRIFAGFTFSLHGFQKLPGFFGGMGGSGATAPFPSLIWFAGFLELVGGLLILVGLFTRPVAFILAGEMAVAYFSAHFVRGFWPIKNGGELAVLYCFIFLYLSAVGGGPLSLDRVLRRK